MSFSAAVQGTNDSSIVSKCSMIKMGYYDDPFIRCFVSKEVRRAPLINRGYYVRCKAIEMILTQFIESSVQFNNSIQIISLGSGFDSLYFRIASKGNQSCEITVFEVDFPEVMNRKLSIINSNETLRNLINNESESSEVKIISDGIVLNTNRYKLLGVDLSEITKLESFLTQCGADFDEVPTLLLSECAITYMDVKSSDNLISWASTKFSNAAFAVYEQISPSDGFGQVMCNHFKSLNCSLRSINTFPDIQSHVMRYKKLGWANCNVIDMNTFYETMITLAERQRVAKLELFEEFEEFHLKCAHYVLICATVGEQLRMKKFPIGNTLNIGRLGDRNIQCHKLETCGKLNRFGHRSAYVKGLILTIGGFGVPTGNCGHLRLEDVFITDLSNDRDYRIPSDANRLLKDGRLFPSLTLLSDGRLVLIGGRTSPLKPCVDIAVFDLKIVPNSTSPENTEVVATTITSHGQERRWKHAATTVFIKGNTEDFRVHNRFIPILPFPDLEYVFLFGGRDEKDAVLGDCQLLSTDTWKWTKVEASGLMPSARHSHSACVWMKNRIVISGGLDENLHPLSSLHVFDGEVMTWAQLEAPTMLPRYSHTSHVFKNKLILLGGVNTTTACPSPGLAIIDLYSGFSSELTLTGLLEPLLLNKHSSILDETREEIVILGGGGTCFSFGTHFNQSAFVVSLDEINEFNSSK